MGSKILSDRYEILEKIGDGGMAVVYKARDKLLSRFVAIKILRPEFIKDQAFVENFRKESKAAASLLHPNIVTVYDVGKESDIYYIVMEYVEGQTLADVISKEAPLDYKRSITIAKQIASALSLAHRNNIIHRDVKPHNVLIASDGTAKITDFGIARATSDDTIISENGVIMGSVHYFSPEQSRGQYVDEKSDIYSLGIVLYEMLTGRVPFDADNPVTIAVMHMNDSIIPPSRMVKGVPPGLDQIVMKATAKFQVDRFKTVDEMFKALDNVNYITGIIDDPAIASFVAPVLAKSGPDEGYSNAAYDDDEYEDDYDDGDYVDTKDDVYDDDTDEDDDEKEATGFFANLFGKGKKSKGGQKGRGKKKKTLSGRFKALAIVLAIVAALAISLGLFKGITYFATDKGVEVPDVIGMDIDDATKALTKQGFKAAIDKFVKNKKYEEGSVTGQDPTGGSKAKKGSTVNLTVVGDEEEYAFTGEIPDLIGKSKASAEYTIQVYGFKLGQVTYADSDAPLDTVIAQTPTAGKDGGTEGQAINITVSKGKKVVVEPQPETPAVEEPKPTVPETTTVPNLSGMNISQMQAAVEGVGLKWGGVTYEDVGDLSLDGIFISQSHGAGTVVNKGTTVTVKMYRYDVSKDTSAGAGTGTGTGTP